METEVSLVIVAITKLLLIFACFFSVVAHYSGTTIDAQERYAAGTKVILDNWFHGKAQTPSDVIVEGGNYTTKAYGQRK